jgi:hypothetical protein
MPPLDTPVIPVTGPYVVSDSGDTLASGDHHFTELLVEAGGKLVVTGPATIVADRFELASNSELIVDADGGPVDIYVINDFVLNSNTLIASSTFTPADVDVELDPDEIGFESNAQLFGTLYAPQAAIEIDSNFELFGAIVARRLTLDSNSRVHYDQALLQETEEEGSSSFQRLCWRMIRHGVADAN